MAVFCGTLQNPFRQIIETQFELLTNYTHTHTHTHHTRTVFLTCSSCNIVRPGSVTCRLTELAEAVYPPVPPSPPRPVVRLLPATSRLVRIALLLLPLRSAAGAATPVNCSPGRRPVFFFVALFSFLSASVTPATCVTWTARYAAPLRGSPPPSSICSCNWSFGASARLPLP